MVTVRPIVASDKDAWLSLFRDYIVFYKASVSEAVIAQTWQRLLGQEDNMKALVAVDESGKALGIAALVFHRSTWSARWYCYLEDLFVAPEARGLGVGRSLIEATYAEADSRGADRTYWATQESNATARKLYDRIGTLSEFVLYRR